MINMPRYTSRYLSILKKLFLALSFFTIHNVTVAQNLYFEKGERYTSIALQQQEEGDFKPAIESFKLANYYFINSGINQDSIVGINCVLIALCMEQMNEVDSAYYYDAKAYILLKPYTKDYLNIINDIEQKMLSKYMPILDDDTLIFYANNLINSSKIIFGEYNEHSAWAHYILGTIYFNNYYYNKSKIQFYKFIDQCHILKHNSNLNLYAANYLAQIYRHEDDNLDSSLTFYTYILNNDNNYEFSKNNNIHINIAYVMLGLKKEHDIPKIMDQLFSILNINDIKDANLYLEGYDLLYLSYKGINRFDKALEVSNSYYALAVKYFSNNDSLVVSAKLKLAEALISCGDNKNSFDILKAYRYKDTLFDKLPIVIKLHTLDLYKEFYRQNGQVDSLLIISKVKIDISLRVNPDTNAAVLSDLCYLANDLTWAYKNEEAGKIYNIIYRHYKNDKLDKYLRLTFVENFTNYLVKIGNFDRANTVFDEVINILSDEGNIGSLINIYTSKADMFKLKGLHDSALYCYRHNIFLANKIERKEAKAFWQESSYFNLASFYIDENNYLHNIDSAYYYLNLNINECKSIISKASMVRRYAMLAVLFQEKNQIDSAIYYLQLYRNQHTDLDKEPLVIYYMGMATCFRYNKSDFLGAATMLDSASSIIKENLIQLIGQYKLLFIAYRNLYTEFNQPWMVLEKTIEFVDNIQRFNGDSSIQLLDILTPDLMLYLNSFLNLNTRVSQLGRLQFELVNKYKSLDLKYKVESDLQLLLSLDPSKAIVYANSQIDANEIFQALGYKGLLRFNQTLCIKYLWLQDTSNALLYSNLNLDLISKGYLSDYNSKYNTAIQGIRCLSSLNMPMQALDWIDYYKIWNLDTFDLVYLREIGWVYRRLNLLKSMEYFSSFILNKTYAIQSNIMFLPYDDRASYISEFKMDLRNYESNLYFFRDSFNIEMGYNTIIQSANILMNSENEFRNILNNNSNMEISYIYELIEAKQDSIDQYFNADFMTSDQSKKMYAEIYELQNKLMLLLQNTFNVNSRDDITFSNIRDKLKDNEALVHYRKITYSENPDSSLYYSFFISKGCEKPCIVNHFLQKDLNKYVNYITNRDSLNSIYSQDNLYNLLFSGYDNYLNNNITKLYIIPDGDLYKVSFPALRLPNDSFLIETKDVVLLNDVKSIYKINRNIFQSNEINTNSLFFGGIDYRSFLESKKTMEPTKKLAYVLLNKRSTKKNLEYLPGSLTEATELSNLFLKQGYDNTLITGKHATEQMFYSMVESKKPTIIHIATHGYFIERNMLDDNSIKKIDKNINNNLLYNGVFMSGSEHTWNQGEIRFDLNDGLLSGLEVSRTNLTSTELVVLTSCYSGGGAIIEGDGVYGLQRGFRLAGVNNILYALWEIDDDLTINFIKNFYSNLINSGDVQESYNKVIRGKLYLDQYRDTPCIWAGFTLFK